MPEGFLTLPETGIGFSTYTVNLNWAGGKLQSSVLQSVFHMSNIRYLAGSSELSPEVFSTCLYLLQMDPELLYSGALNHTIIKGSLK